MSNIGALAIQQFKKKQDEIEKKLDYKFRNRDHLLHAFTQCSFFNEYPHDTDGNNERLEFLGDSVVSLVVSEFLLRNYPNKREGEMTIIKAHIVDTNTLCSFLKFMEVDHYILLGKGQKSNPSMLADLFEALVGAIYLDGGLDCVTVFFSKFHDRMEDIIKSPSRNWKGLLQDFCLQNFKELPVYNIISEAGPSHQKLFEICVFIQKKEYGKGTALTKKKAEQEAAKIAYSRLELEFDRRKNKKEKNKN